MGVGKMGDQLSTKRQTSQELLQHLSLCLVPHEEPSTVHIW